jgi:4-hydroxybenzoyl-CoA thioesterase/acyl-CoA thioester hydrolase
MSETFSVQRRVEFRDTDAAGIVHFSNFFVYMEQTEHAFLRSLGLGVIFEFDGKPISWPRVKASCDYKTSIRFEEIIDIRLAVERIGDKSVTYRFDFHRGETPVAKGSLTAVCCIYEPGQVPQSHPIPLPFADAIRPYLIP